MNIRQLQNIKKLNFFYYFRLIEKVIMKLFSKTIGILAFLLIINKAHAGLSCFDSLKALNNEGGASYYAGDYRKAEEYFSLSLKQSINCYSNNHPYVADEYNNLGVILSSLWDYDNALVYLNAAKDINEQYDTLQDNLAANLSNIARCYRLKGDYENALAYYNRAINLFSNNKTAKFNKINAFIGMARLQNQLKNYNQGIKIIQQGILENNKSLKDDRIQYNLYETLISLYKNIDQSDSLLFYLKLASNTAWNSNNVSDLERFNSSILLADYYIHSNDFKNAHLNLMLADSLFKTTNYVGLLKLDYILTFAHYFEAKKEFIQASEFYKKGLNIVANDSNSIIKPNNPIETIDLLKDYAQCFINWYYNCNNPDKLVKANDLILNASRISNNLRTSFLSIESKLLLSENENVLNDLGLLSSEILYSKYNRTEYLNKAFYFAEKGKSSVLEEALKEEKAKVFSGIPNVLTKQETDLKREIAFYKEKIYQEKNAQTPDSKKINLWSVLLIELNHDYEKIKMIFEREYPKYYELKYDSKEICLQDVQKKLNRKSTIIEYALSNNKLYTFIINKNKAILIHKPTDNYFFNSISEYLDLFKNFNYLSQGADSYSEYEQIAHDNYLELLGNIPKEELKKYLIIIPDNILSYLPFEALITSKNLKNPNSFLKMNYFLKDHPISYAYSASLFNMTAKDSHSKLKNSVLAIAPEYSYETGEKYAQLKETIAYRNKLQPLPYALEEVKKIRDITNGDFLEGKDATEIHFKQKAPSYDILHLAMHTLIDDKNPLFSKLVFYNKDYLDGKGLLTTNEIFGLKLNAKLTVLSACSTGKGEFRKGEGVMSLSRGFFYAGCPSLIMTQWKVEDKSSLDLMSSFYINLKKGSSKSKALQEAKLEYLKNIPEQYRHPFFWSSYIIIGNDSPIYINLRSYFILSIIFLSALFFFLRQIKRKRNKL